MKPPLPTIEYETFSRRLIAEFVGTAMLLSAVAGSGIMAEGLTTDGAVALLANTVSTGAALLVLILAFGPVSGAHFNPAVSLSAALVGDLSWTEAFIYALTQIAGALLGVALANQMFDLPVFFASTKVRTGFGQWLGEFVATFGLVGLIISVSRRHKVPAVAVAVAMYITAAYWFTSSTSFANPAVTIARSLTDTFTGIRPIDAPVFIAVQFLAATAATFLFIWLTPNTMKKKEKVLILCTGNSARSQMAEGLLNRIAGNEFDVESAGVAPSRVRPEAITVMSEVHIDIAGNRSKSVDEFRDEAFDYIITVCDNAKESCPVFPGNAKRIHWSFEDPAAVVGSDEERLAAFRKSRDEINAKLDEFVLTLEKRESPREHVTRGPRIGLV